MGYDQEEGRGRECLHGGDTDGEWLGVWCGEADVAVELVACRPVVTGAMVVMTRRATRFPKHARAFGECNKGNRQRRESERDRVRRWRLDLDVSDRPRLNRLYRSYFTPGSTAWPISRKARGSYSSR